MTTFTFSDRATYLAFRASWKARYHAISEQIRENKRAQAANKGGDNSVLQSKLHYLRSDANDFMVELAEAKEFKAQQFAARAAVEA